MAQRMNHDKANRFSKARQDVREALEDGDISEMTAWVGDDQGLDKLPPQSYARRERTRGTVTVVYGSTPTSRPAQSAKKPARRLTKKIISSGSSKQKSTPAPAKPLNKPASGAVAELKRLLTAAEVNANCQKLAESLASVKHDVALTLMPVPVNTSCAACIIKLKTGKKHFTLFKQPDKFVCQNCAFSIRTHIKNRQKVQNATATTPAKDKVAQPKKPVLMLETIRVRTTCDDCKCKLKVGRKHYRIGSSNKFLCQNCGQGRTSGAPAYTVRAKKKTSPAMTKFIDEKINQYKNRKTRVSLKRREPSLTAAEIQKDKAQHYCKIAIAHYENQDYKKAIEMFNLVISLDSGNATAYYHRGLTNFQLRKYELAKADYEKAVVLAPSHAESYESRLAMDIKEKERKLLEEAERKRLLEEAAQRRLEEPPPAKKRPKKNGGSGFRSTSVRSHGGKPEWYSADPG